MNLNKLAKKIASLEGGKVNLSIAQVKEVMRHLLDELALADLAVVLQMLRSRKDRIVKTTKRKS